MKILKLVYSYGKASGGHFHSCDQISQRLGQELDISVVTFGSVPSPVLISNPFFKAHINFFSIKDLYKLNHHINKIKKEFNFNIVHCYDTFTLNLALILPILYRTRIVLTKCGSQNPLRKNWQHAHCIINFSAENHNWFTSNKKYRNSQLFLIPNRILPFQIESDIIKKENTFNILRISRLGGAYEKTLLDTYNLVDLLKDNFNIKLYVIGRIQDSDRFQNIKEIARQRNLPVEFITDVRASNAKQFLNLADVVVGTGRSLMEAMSKGIPCLTPARNYNLPILVGETNFDSFFNTNFSERNFASNDCLANNISKIKKLIINKDYYSEQSKLSLQSFNTYFNLNNAFEDYHSVYNLCLKLRNRKFKLIFNNSLFIVRELFKL